MVIYEMIIEIAENAGYCFGVERALLLAEKVASEEKDNPVHTLGPLIHNEPVVEKLAREKNIHPAKDVESAGEGTIIIRAHGVPPEMYREAEKRGLKIVDATCPFVLRVQELAKKLIAEGYTLIIFGDRDHEEVLAIQKHAGDKAIVIQDISDLPQKQFWGRVGIVIQTTQRADRLAELVNKMIPVSAELKVYNTICDATEKRQDAARDLAKRAQAMVVVGGKQSGNTKRLAQICKEHQPRTYLVTTADELREEWFENIQHIGITAGASTPEEAISEVVERLAEYAKRNNQNPSVVRRTKQNEQTRGSLAR